LSGISQQLEGLIESHEERQGRDVRIREKGILEVDLKGRGMRISALEMRFPQHESKHAHADEHHDYLQEYC
jgi:hypothetical protein